MPVRRYLIASKNCQGSDQQVQQERDFDYCRRKTGKHLREVQLAKGAIAAGISILLKRAGYSFDRVDKLIIAGGFGNYLGIESAMRIGLLPKEMKGRTIQIVRVQGHSLPSSLKCL